MKTNINTRPFDAAEYLKSEASVAAYVSDAMEADDPDILQNALNTAARARGMAQIAEDSGLGRESLYKALRPGAKPQFGTIVKVLGALGVKLVPQPAADGKSGAFVMGKKSHACNRNTTVREAVKAKRTSAPKRTAKRHASTDA